MLLFLNQIRKIDYTMIDIKKELKEKIKSGMDSWNEPDIYAILYRKTLKNLKAGALKSCHAAKAKWPAEQLESEDFWNLPRFLNSSKKNLIFSKRS